MTLTVEIFDNLRANTQQIFHLWVILKVGNRAAKGSMLNEWLIGEELEGSVVA